MGDPCGAINYTFTKPQRNAKGYIMQDTLEHIVSTHFPLITDRFNYKLGSILGFSIGYSRSTYSVILSIKLKDICLYTSVNNETDYINKYTEYTTKVFYNYKDNTNFNQLVSILIENITPRINKLFEKRKKDIDRLCELEYARYKKPHKNEFTKILGDYNKKILINVYYTETDKYKKSFRYISRNRNKPSFIITKETISDCLNDLEETFILNDKQREEILIRLNHVINHNVKVAPTQSIDITQNDLECIKKGLEDALNYQTKHVTDNSITTKEKWKRYNTSPDTYAAWLIVNNHLVLMQKPLKS